MNALASLVMAGRSRAALVVAAGMFFALLVPPVLLLSGGALALVTLRRGPADGAWVLGLACLGAVVLGWLLFDGPGPVAGVLPGYWLPVWLLAATLRASVSLALTVSTAVGLGWLAIGAFGLLFDDPAAWWYGVLSATLKPAFEGVIDASTLEAALRTLAPLMPGVLAANVMLSALLGVLVGRWWQARLYNPGGFRREFHALRLGRVQALLATVLIAAALALDIPWLVNLALVLGLGFALQGLAVVHGLVAARGMKGAWLIALYVALVLAMPQVAVALCALGLIDCWLDLRARAARAGVR